ncbi:MAG: APC family permease [Anaerolineaceae bacterium]|nr:APC family permease [Anaerolineaceae bacterium]
MASEPAAQVGAPSSPVTDQAEGAEILHQLGYKQELNRGLSILGNVSIAVSDISPTTGLFLQLPVILVIAGTGAFWAFVVGGILALCVALTMGELGSRYPVAGGLYSIVLRVLGKPLGFVAFVDYLLQGVFIPGTVGLAAAGYLAAIIGIDVRILAPIVMALATLIAIMNITQGAKFVGFFLVMELLVVVILGFVTIIHPVQSVGILFNPINFTKDSPVAAQVGLGAIFAAVTVAMFGFNGYDSAINFSEETSGAAANVGKSVFNAAWIGIAFQIIPMIGIILAAPDLAKFLTSDAPITYIGEARLGNIAGAFLNIGAAIAMFNCTIACVIQFARVLYSSGRDKAWPMPINNALTKVSSRFKTPWVASIVVGVMAGVLVFFSSLLAAVTFISVMIVLLYALIAVCDITARIRGMKPGFKMPFWPLPPVLAILGALAALSQQKVADIAISAGVVVLALIYYYAYLKPRSDTHWMIK